MIRLGEKFNAAERHVAEQIGNKIEGWLAGVITELNIQPLAGGGSMCQLTAFFEKNHLRMITVVVGEGFVDNQVRVTLSPDFLFFSSRIDEARDDLPEVIKDTLSGLKSLERSSIDRAQENANFYNTLFYQTRAAVLGMLKGMLMAGKSEFRDVRQPSTGITCNLADLAVAINSTIPHSRLDEKITDIDKLPGYKAK